MVRVRKRNSVLKKLRLLINEIKDLKSKLIVIVEILVTKLEFLLKISFYFTNFIYPCLSHGVHGQYDGNTSMTYIVDTKDSFAFVEANESRRFVVQGDTCFISAWNENESKLYVSLYLC